MQFVYTEVCGCIVHKETETIIVWCETNDCILDKDMTKALEVMESGIDEYPQQNFVASFL